MSQIDNIRAAIANTNNSKSGVEKHSAKTHNWDAVRSKFNDDHAIDDILRQAGYEQKRDRWVHPNSQSGMPGLIVLPDGKIYSHNNGDVLANGHAWDAFGLVCRFDYGDDIKAMISAVKGEYTDLMPTKQVKATPVLQKEGLFTTVTVAEAINYPPPEWILEDLIVEDSINLIVGAPDTGKSFVALDLATQLIQGECEFAKHWYIPNAHRVLYMTDEGVGTFFSAQGRLISMLRHKQLYADGSYHPACDNLMFCTDMLNLSFDTDGETTKIDGKEVYVPSAFERFCDTMADFAPTIIIIDTYAASTVGLEENSNREAAMVAEHMKALKSTMSCSLFILHHTPKGAGTRGGATVGRGASATAGTADSVLLLSAIPDEPDKALLTHEKKRHVRGQPPQICVRVNHPGFYYPYLDWEEQTEAVKKSRADDREVLLAVLGQTWEKGATQKDLSEALDWTKPRAARVLNDLLADRQIRRSLADPDKKPSKANQFRYYFISKLLDK